MKTKKEGSLCPKCAQTCSRRWNLMIHIDRRHPEIGGEANPIRQAHYSANIPNHTNRNTNHDWRSPGWKHLLTRNNPYIAGVFSSHTAYSSATPFYNTPTESLLRRYEEDGQEELATKRRESERIRSRQQFEDYQAALKIRETESRKRMGGILGFDIMSEISNQMATGRLIPVMTIEREGSISIRYEPTNKENEVKPLAVNWNDLSIRQFQDILAKLVEAQAEFTYNFIKCMEARKHNFDVTDEELVQIFAGGVKASQANNSRAEQSIIEEKPQVVSEQSSRVEEKNDNRYDGEEEKTSWKEHRLDDFVNLSGSNCEMYSNMAPPAPPPPPIDSALFHSKSHSSQMSSRKLEPLGKENGQEVKQGSRPDQYSGRLPRPQEHFSSGQDYSAHGITDEEIKKELEDAAKTQIIAIQKIKNGKTGRTIFGQSFYPVPESRY